MLDDHVATVHNDAVDEAVDYDYGCAMCSNGFDEQSDLQKHERDVHNVRSMLLNAADMHNADELTTSVINQVDNGDN